ncbi:MAG: hypothetical protein GY852_02890, partial [bacterium]|nr:hypothetical protein [bacterium]
IGCEKEDWICILEPEGSEDPMVVPVCPNIETSACTSNCSAVFCGNFFYDPRPPWGMLPQDEAHDVPDDDGEGNTDGVMSEPIGLWKAQCIVQKMDTLFLRKVENTDDLVMNTFRFGVGSSFEDFEEAQYYFPLTDRACELNPSGDTDRYIVYAIPNTKQSGGELCEKDGGVYTCTVDGNIESYSYFECASKCALEIYGYEPEIEPYNPYLTRVDGENIGNPFAYAPDRAHNTNNRYPDYYAGIVFDDEYRDRVGTLGNDHEDGYADGTVLYGATFGDPKISQDDNSDDYFMLELLAYQGYRATASSPAAQRIPDLTYADTGFSFKWNWGTDGSDTDWDGRARTRFITEEENPHELYPWLLAHHSVYNKQFESGHLLASEETKSGAEFECTTGAECLSAYCNNFDYKRGACVGVDGADILCDCNLENGKTICIGSAGVNFPAWDNPSVSVESPKTLASPVDIYGKARGGTATQTIANLPSIGVVRQVQVFDYEGEEEQYVPFFVMHLGGGHLSGTFDVKVPDYKLYKWADIVGHSSWSDTDREDQIYMMRWMLDPCGAIPGSNWWAATIDDEKDVYCCDGTTSCATTCTQDDVDDEDNECETVTEVHGYASTGKQYTRFVENCMDGYRNSVHVCYSADAKDKLGIWGFTLGSGGPFTSHYDQAWFDLDFCEIFGNGGGGEFTAAIGDKDLGDENPYEAFRCYLWASGGHFPLGSADECLAESESYLVIEPRRVEVDGRERWAFGNCLVNAQKDGLEINEYGICESCGYLTMAKQELTSFPAESDPALDDLAFDRGEMDRNAYCPDMVIHTPHNHDSIRDRASADAPFGNYVLEPYGMGNYNQYEFGSFLWTAWGSYCTYPNGYELTHGGNSEALPYTKPNAFYINRKLESMMKRNIQPVIFAVDDYLWAEYTGDPDPANRVLQMWFYEGDFNWANNQLMEDISDHQSYLLVDAPQYQYDTDNLQYYAPGSFLANTIINEGAAILVINHYPSGTGFDGQTFERAKAVRFLCPNCMSSVSIGYRWDGSTPEGQFDMDMRISQIDDIFSNSQMYTYVDAIAVNMLLQDGDNYCSIADEGERFPQILANMTYLGRETLKRHRRNLVVSDFIIDRSGSCWSEASAGRFMAYLGTHREELAKAGYLGLIYGDWQSNDGTGVRWSKNHQIYGYRGGFYEGMFTSARNFAGHEFTTFYTEVFVTDECQCVPCTNADPPSICNGKFQGIAAEKCGGYASGTNVKWPEDCVTRDVCHFAPSTVESISCDVLYNNGTSEHLPPIPLEEVISMPSAYRDVIASLDTEYPLCLENAGTGVDVTYVKLEQNGYQGTPLVFAEDGNPDEVCDPTQGLMDSFCGYYPPIGNYKMECTYNYYAP